MTDEITFDTTGEWCPMCEHENEITVDYREVVKVLKGDSSASIPLIHCEECGNRLAPCSFCSYAIQDGYITFAEMTCDNCPITKYWNNKYGEDLHGEDPMTDEKKTPTLDEIQKSFFAKCQLHQNGYEDDYMQCPHCDYRCFGDVGYGGGCNGDLDSQGDCERHYIYEVATGARDINKPLWNPPKEELPEWFQDGALLLDKEGNLIEVVDYETYDDRKAVYFHYKPKGGEEENVKSPGAILYEDMCKGEVFKPIKFRKYKSVEEAEALLGKKLRFTSRDQNKIAVEIVNTIARYSESELLVNNYYQDYLFERGATIDGLPIGIPVVDEEAMKGGGE